MSSGIRELSASKLLSEVVVVEVLFIMKDANHSKAGKRLT
jgi:hypothetical protein